MSAPRGNPEISDGINLPIGPHTEPIICYGLVATPGIVDSHVHLITLELIPTALSAGVTTLIGVSRLKRADHGDLTVGPATGNAG